MNHFKAPIHDSEVEAVTWCRGTDREIVGRAICDVGGPSKIGFGILELSPGCNTRPAHHHTQEEEHLYVLEGTGTLHLGKKVFPLVKGSYANFPAGQEEFHFISNESEGILKYIMVGERIENDEVRYADDL